MKIKKFITLSLMILSLLCVALGATACAGNKKFSISQTEATLTVGETLTLTATVPEGGKLNWRSSDTNVAKVLGGVVTAVSSGDAEISVYYGSESLSCNITVNPAPSDAIGEVLTVGIGANRAELEVGGEPQGISAVAYRNYAKVAGANFTWSSGDDSIATVSPVSGDSSKAYITAVGSGETTVTASYGGKSASCNVTVSVIKTVSGTVSVASGMGKIDISEAQIELNNGKGTPITLFADQNGHFEKNVATGIYDVTFTHPAYRDVVLENVVISDNKTDLNGTFDYYKLGAKVHGGGIYSYGETANTYNMVRPAADANGKFPSDGHASQFLGGICDSKYVMSAKINMTGEKDNKYGIILYAQSTSNVQNNYLRLIFSPSQNQVNLYNQGWGGEVDLNSNSQKFNGAVAASNALRLALPSGVINNATLAEGLYTKEFTVKVVRYNENVWVYVNGTLYIRINLTAFGITDNVGFIGFSNQNQKEVTISELNCLAGEEDTSAALVALGQKAQINASATGGGNVSVVSSGFIGSNAEITVTPDDNKELYSLTVDGNDVTAYVSDNKYTFSVENATHNIVATFGNILQSRTVSGTLSVSPTIALSGVDFASAKAVFVPTSGGKGVTLSSNAAGTFAGQVADGTYSVTVTHDYYADRTYDNVVISDNVSNLSYQYNYYKLGAGYSNDGVWSYGSTANTYVMNRPASNTSDGMQYQYLAGVKPSKYVFEATINMTGEQYNKFGLILYAPDATSNSGILRLMFSPSQNQVSLHNVGDEILFASSQLLNGATQAGASGNDAKRVALPSGVINNATKDGNLFNKEFTVKVVRDGRTVWVAVNGTVYLKITLPEAIGARAGVIGFAQQNQKTVTISALKYDVGNDAVTAAKTEMSLS